MSDFERNRIEEQVQMLWAELTSRIDERANRPDCPIVWELLQQNCVELEKKLKQLGLNL